MSANTAKGYPYPVGTDRVMDGDNDIQALASAVDTKAGLLASGTVVITLTAAQVQNAVLVTFPASRFTVAPAVAAVTDNSAFFCCAVGVTATSYNLYAVSRSGTGVAGSPKCSWIARQE